MPASRRRAAAKDVEPDPAQQPQTQQQEQPEQQPPQPQPSEQSAGDDTNTLLRQVLAQQQEHRAEVAELRAEINQRKQAPPAPSSQVRTPEELADARREEISQHQFYCPACGALYDRERECTGRGEAPHPPLDVISTKELEGDDTSKHTAAPGVSP